MPSECATSEKIVYIDDIDDKPSESSGVIRREIAPLSSMRQRSVLDVADAATHSVTHTGTARAARRLLKMQRKVSAWWHPLPTEARAAYYTGAQVAAAVGQPITALGPALGALGWRRELVRIDTEQVGLWLPPGAPSIKRPVGRPSLAQLAQIAMQCTA
jgi:hypothetical protein